MKVKVLTTFHDANDFAKVYAAGEVVEFTDERGNSLVRLQLVEPVTEQKRRGRKSKTA